MTALFAVLFLEGSADALASPASRVLLAILFLIGAVWLMLKYLQYQAERISEAWLALAAELDFTYKPARGPAFRRKNEEIEGTVEGVTVRLTRYGLSPGLDSAIYTRWGAELDPQPDFVLYVHRRHALSKVAASLGYEDVPTGDPSFDAQFSTKVDDPAKLAVVLTDEVRGKISALRSAVILINETGINVVWSGQIVAIEELKRGLDTIRALVKVTPRGKGSRNEPKPSSAEAKAPDAGTDPMRPPVS